MHSSASHAPPATLRWVSSGEAAGHLQLLDQTRLPGEVRYLDCRTADEVWHAIRRLAVRGAPAIGVAAAYGACLAACGPAASEAAVRQACAHLATSRPTAVNLFWALDRMRSAAAEVGDAAGLAPRLLAEARRIEAEDRQTCAAIGAHGADWLAALPEQCQLLTHCNAGSLATAGDGTALAVVFELARRGKRPHVWVDETRPLLQGARLTAWELAARGIDCTLICDGMAAWVMRRRGVHAVITGADRIAANGDAANKIGTYGLALVAAAHDVPFFVAAPRSTFDRQIAAGDQIPIEERPGDEIAAWGGVATAPAGVACFNPAFDVTPARLIAGLITDAGVVAPPSVEAIAAALFAS
jgi:methylthioribose-1-phosphate isomerase